MIPEQSAAKQLAGRCALVTGSSRNLGVDIATALAERGATVAITFASSRAVAEENVAALRERTGGEHVAVRGDASTTAGVRAMVNEATDALGGHVDILVNNFGPFALEPLASLPVEEWERIWAGNVTAAYLATQLVTPGMREQGWGRVVNISAGSAYMSNHSVYGLAKQAVISLTENLALELGPEIIVNGVAPGQIQESEPDVSVIDPTFVQRCLERTPAGRLVTRREVADLVALLCTSAFDMVTGVTLPIDGGWRLNRF